MSENKDLLKCSLDELLTEKQKAIEVGNLDRYRECDRLISAMYVLVSNRVAVSK
jgi:hypothetical protein